MNQVTFLGDVSLLSPIIKSQYDIQGQYIFNLEYVMTDSTKFPKKNKVNLASEKIDFTEVFGKKPIAVSLANNHIMDYGVQGFKDTISLLDKMNISYFGAGSADKKFNNPFIYESENNKVAFISYSMFDEKEDDFGVSFFDEKKAKQDIEIAKKQCDTIIINMHWGEEEAPLHNSKQQKIGHLLVDMGADLVIGHHPHCIQPFEVYKDKYIFYSLGNCIFPDFSNKAFYDDKNCSQRIFRKRQLKYNKLSYAVCFDLNSKKVVAIDKLFFNKNILKKVKSIDLNPKSIYMPKSISEIIKRKRKYQNFLWSNFCIDGKFFDLNALNHEIQMKKGQKKQ